MRLSRRRLRNLAVVGGCLLALAMVFHPGAVRADWLQDLEADAAAWMTEAGIPGMAMAIVKNDVVIYAKGFGHLSNEPNSPLVNADTVFDIGSCSKAFGAAQIAMLADEKRLAWNDPVRNHLTWFKMFDPWVNKQFQVEDLLCHRSGLSWYSYLGMCFLGYTPGQQVRAIRYKEPGTSFRSAFAYQNHMYVAAAKLVEAKTGQAWKENLRQRIFVPLGMNRSVTTEAEANRLPNVASGHLLLADGSLARIPRRWTNHFVTDNMLAAGAIKSTANDMAQWLRLNLALGKFGIKQIVSETNMRSIQSPRMLMSLWDHGPASPYSGPVSYGGGWMYFGLAPQPIITHDGTEVGFKASVLLVPGANIGIVVLSNMGADYTGKYGARVQTAQKIAFRFYDLYFGRETSLAQLEENVLRMEKVSGPPPSPAPISPKDQAPPFPLENYCGTYYHPAYGDFVVSLAGGQLEITMGPRQIRAPLEYNDTDQQFRAYLPDYHPNYPLYYPFTFDLSSSPATMTLAAVMGWPQNDVFTRTGN